MPENLKEKIKTRLWRSLSPEGYEFARLYGWYLFDYFPHLVASRFVRRRPEVYGYGSGPGVAALVRRLSDINVAAPTRMCRIMTRHGSDKGKGWHNYTTVYSELLRGLLDRKDLPIRIFELGIGTNNPDEPSSMGAYGHPGASLRGWQELFPKAWIYGADIDRSILFQEDRIETCYCDQLDKESIRQLWSNPALQGGLELIIEDGLHTFEGNISFLDNSLGSLRPGGIYVIEDIDHSVVSRWKEQLQAVYAPRYPDFAFALTLLPSPLNSIDNNLLIICRNPT